MQSRDASPESTIRLTQFSEMPLSAELQRKLALANFTIPTAIQAETIPHALAGRDILATAQTGTGKTLAFLVPLIERLLQTSSRNPEALILVPTRELAMQVHEQYEKLRDNKLAPAALVIGGLAERAQIQALRSGARVIVATPGRLEDFLGRRLVRLETVKTLVLDEADRMLDMGFLWPSGASRRCCRVIAKRSASRRPWKPPSPAWSMTTCAAQYALRRVPFRSRPTPSNSTPLKFLHRRSQRSYASFCTLRRAVPWCLPAPSAVPSDWPRAWCATVSPPR